MPLIVNSTFPFSCPGGYLSLLGLVQRPDVFKVKRAHYSTIAMFWYPYFFPRDPQL